MDSAVFSLYLVTIFEKSADRWIYIGCFFSSSARQELISTFQTKKNYLTWTKLVSFAVRQTFNCKFSKVSDEEIFVCTGNLIVMVDLYDSNRQIVWYECVFCSPNFSSAYLICYYTYFYLRFTLLLLSIYHKSVEPYDSHSRPNILLGLLWNDTGRAKQIKMVTVRLWETLHFILPCTTYANKNKTRASRWMLLSFSLRHARIQYLRLSCLFFCMPPTPVDADDAHYVRKNLLAYLCKLFFNFISEKFCHSYAQILPQAQRKRSLQR